MMSSYPLINTIVASIVLAFIFGYITKRMKLPSILGYLVAGVLIGPHTPGFVADQEMASQLAEIGVILLMFGVGMHFSLKDLLSIRKIALPGALFQMGVATLIGFIFLFYRGAMPAEALVFGFSLSVASTVVLLRMLDQRKQLTTQAGRITIGWLVVEDIAMVLAIVLLPVLASTIQDETHVFDPDKTLLKLFITLTKIIVFAVLMVFFGRRFLPVLLVKIAKLKSRELMSLGTLAIAIGFAFLAHKVFDASFALGAFLAGMVLNESPIGQKSAEQSLPLRDIFAVIFFVSVGMLFNPAVLVNDPLSVLAVIAIIIFGKGLAALCITHIFKQPMATSFIVAVSLAQIGEFSFIFAGVAKTMGILQQDSYDLILAGALISIAVNPFLFQISDKVLKKLAAKK